MDLSKMRDAIKSIPPSEMKERIEAMQEIGRLKEMCRGKGDIEVEKLSLRIKILKKTENVNKLLELLKKWNLESVLVKEKE